MAKNEVNRWQALVTGVIGSVAGLIAMRYYWQEVAPQVLEQFGPEKGDGPSSEIYPDMLDLDRPFIDRRYYRRGETSTEAIGRLLYTEITGQEPESEQLRQTLSYLVHWGYGLLQGGIYGVNRANARFPDLFGGLRFGTRLWFFGDELFLPLLGLQSGPTAVPPAQHVNRLGAHWSYGATTAVAAKLLQALL